MLFMVMMSAAMMITMAFTMIPPFFLGLFGLFLLLALFSSSLEAVASGDEGRLIFTVMLFFGSDFTRVVMGSRTGGLLRLLLLPSSASSSSSLTSASPWSASMLLLLAKCNFGKGLRSSCNKKASFWWPFVLTPCFLLLTTVTTDFGVEVASA